MTGCAWVVGSITGLVAGEKLYLLSTPFKVCVIYIGGIGDMLRVRTHNLLGTNTRYRQGAEQEWHHGLAQRRAELKGMGGLGNGDQRAHDCGVWVWGGGGGGWWVGAALVQVVVPSTVG
jgi:hypothetical protein